MEKSEFVKAVRINDSAINWKIFFQEIGKDKNVRVMVLIFDLEETANPGQPGEKMPEDLRNRPVPVIVGLAGTAAVEIIQAAHLCIAGENSRFILADLKEIGAGEALKLGLINQIVPAAEVEKEAFALAEKIAELAPLAIRACLRAVGEGLEMPLEDGLKLETELFTRIFSSDDMREGTRAFLEKRRPVFHGR